MQKLILFLKEGIWLEPLDPKRPFYSFFLRFGRIALGTIRGFVQDECFLKASALTFYTLLSIIPVVAVAFGVAKGFGFEEGMQTEILKRFKQQPEVGQAIVDFSYSLLKHAEGGIIAAIGSVILLWSVLKLLGNIETSLNSIWKVPNSRHFLRQFTDYIALMLLLPIFFVASGSFTLLIASELRQLSSEGEVLHLVRPAILTIFKLIPYALNSLLFALIYFLLPNTKVSLRAAFIAGILAGSSYQIVQWFYIHFQIGVAGYGAIYGSFAAFPLFLLWIHISWLIVMAGAEIAYNFESETVALSSSSPRTLTSQTAVGLLVARSAAQNFSNEKGAVYVSDIARLHGIPLNIARTIAVKLADAGILIEVKSGKGYEQYLPGRELSKIKISNVLEALNPMRKKNVSIFASDEFYVIEKALKEYNESLTTDIHNYPLIKLGE